jgi:regulator of protease activity HflC (stomatin/prohibitin superfamily)
MADLTKIMFFRHIRGEASAQLLHWRNGLLVRSGVGLSFWFMPLSASIAEVPVDLRDQVFLFQGRTSDAVEITVQATVSYRIADPLKAAERFDFTLELDSGNYRKTPLDSIAAQITGLAGQLAEGVVSGLEVRALVEGGHERLRGVLGRGLQEDEGLASLGIEVGSVRIASIRPSAELERALQMPAREGIQQQADQATFARRASAVEHERAIAENELANRIELSRREEELIAQDGANARRKATEVAEAKKIAVVARSQHRGLESAAEAESVRLVEGAKVVAERARMEIYRDLPTSVIVGLAAQELAGKLTSIEHLNVTPDLFGPAITNLIQAGTRKLGEAS